MKTKNTLALVCIISFISLVVFGVLVFNAAVNMQHQKNMIRDVATEINNSLILAPLTMEVAFNVEAKDTYATCNNMTPVVNVKSSLFYKLDPQSAKILLLTAFHGCLQNLPK